MVEVRQLRRARAATDLSVGQLSLTELHHELQRRVNDLQQQKEELHERIERIDQELAALGPLGPIDTASGTASGTGTRPKRSGGVRSINEAPLKVVLTRLLEGNALTTREAAEAVLESGYVSNSQNFANTVGVSLHREPRFVKTDGKWTVVEVAEE